DRGARAGPAGGGRRSCELDRAHRQHLWAVLPAAERTDARSAGRGRRGGAGAAPVCSRGGERSVSEMGLVVVGAGGRMGQTLIRTIHEMDGVRLAGAVEREGSPLVGRDAGEVAGIGASGVTVSDDPLPVFARADGVLDFTTPAATT